MGPSAAHLAAHNACLRVPGSVAGTPWPDSGSSERGAANDCLAVGWSFDPANGNRLANDHPFDGQDLLHLARIRYPPALFYRTRPFEKIEYNYRSIRLLE